MICFGLYPKLPSSFLKLEGMIEIKLIRLFNVFNEGR